MVDFIAWKQYGDESKYVEAMLESPDNYRLCDQSEILLAGTIVVLPDVKPTTIPVAHLWD